MPRLKKRLVFHYNHSQFKLTIDFFVLWILVLINIFFWQKFNFSNVFFFISVLFESAFCYQVKMTWITLPCNVPFWCAFLLLALKVAVGHTLHIQTPPEREFNLRYLQFWKTGVGLFYLFLLSHIGMDSWRVLSILALVKK